MPTDEDDTRLAFALPSVCKKKVTAAFDAGRISSDGGVLLLAGADKGSVANFLDGHAAPEAVSGFIPPASRIAALDALRLSTATDPSGSWA